MAGLEAQPIRTDIVLKVMSLAHRLCEVKAEELFLSRAKDIVQDTKPFIVVQGLGRAVQTAQALFEVRIHAHKKGASLINVFSAHRDGNILVL